MSPFRYLQLIAPLTAATLLTLTVAPSATAEPTFPISQIPQVQEPHTESHVITTLGSITDIFSCKHHPALPWCNQVANNERA